MINIEISRNIEMNSVNLEKFSTQLQPEIIRSLKDLAQLEGKKLQSIINEALAEYLQRRTNLSPRKEVMQAFAESVQEFDELYKALAK